MKYNSGCASFVPFICLIGTVLAFLQGKMLGGDNKHWFYCFFFCIFLEIFLGSNNVLGEGRSRLGLWP